MAPIRAENVRQPRNAGGLMVRESRAGPGSRRPRAGRAVIVADFSFRGNSAANNQFNFHDHAPGPRRAAVPRCRGVAVPPDNPDETGTLLAAGL